MLTVYKIRNTKEPEYLSNIISRDNFRGNLMVQATGLTLARRSFCFRGGDSWLSIPVTIRNIKKVSHFKKSLRTWIKKSVPRFLD